MVRSLAVAAVAAAALVVSPAAHAKTCGVGDGVRLVANAHTSCAFALATAEAFNADPQWNATYRVWSPTTEQWYRMRCRARPARVVLRCTGGANALVKGGAAIAPAIQT